MSAFESPISGAVLYELGPHANTQQTTLLEDVYAGSGIAVWAEERSEKSNEIIEPALLYVTPGEDMHRVAWVRHSGMRENELDELVPYSTHHVICDCAAETQYESNAEGNKQIIAAEGMPKASVNREYVQAVLLQRAGELAIRHRITEMLGTYTLFDLDDLDFKLTTLGQELAIRSIASLLEIDRNHPEWWAANKINGLHEVEFLAAYLGYGSEEVMPILEIMEEGEILLITGDEVRLQPTKMARGVDACSEDDIRDALTTSLIYKDKISRADMASVLQKLLAARVTQETPSLKAEIQAHLKQFDDNL